LYTNYQPCSLEDFRETKELLCKMINIAYKNLSPKQWFIYDETKYLLESFDVIHTESIDLDINRKRLYYENRFCVCCDLLFYIYGTGFQNPEINENELIKWIKKNTKFNSSIIITKKFH